MTNCLGKKLFIPFTVRVFREFYSVCVCTSFPLGFKGGVGDLIIMTFLFYFAFLSSTRIYTGIYIRGVISDSRYTFIRSVLNISAACNRQLNSQVFKPPLG